MESPAEKRMRKCGTPRRKRTDPQLRPHRVKLRLTEAGEALRAKMDEIRAVEEKLKLVGSMRTQRMAPIQELGQRVVRLEKELHEARLEWQGVQSPDMSDLDEKDRVLQSIRDRLKTEAAEIIARNSVDPSLPSP